MLNERKKKILQIIIEDYISSAEPVGSRTIARKYDLGLSPATIRNEMSDLELLGYLEQPHTSAGRIPSAQAYRFYVDALIEPGTLTDNDTHRRSKSCHTRRTQRIIRTLKHDTANGRNGELQSHRNANGKQRLRQLRLILPFFRRAPQNVKLPIHINVTKKSGNSLRKDSSNGSSHHSPAQYQNTE